MLSGSGVPARHAEEGHQGCKDPREDEAGEAGGGRQPDPAGQKGQDQEQSAAAGRAWEGPTREPVPGPHQRHRQGWKNNSLSVGFKKQF